MRGIDKISNNLFPKVGELKTRFTVRGENIKKRPKGQLYLT